MTLLRTQNLTKQFGGLTAVDQVDIEVEPGTLVSVIGPNGAGKSTLINLITGKFEPTTGEIHYKDVDITEMNPHEITQLGIGRSFQTASIFPELTVRENVEIPSFATEHGAFTVNFLRRREHYGAVTERSRRVLELVDLAEDADEVASSLSYGDKRRLEIAIGLATEPELLFMDEPTAGMSPSETQLTTDLIEQMRTDLGITVVLVEHDMDIVFDLSDRVIVLHRGSVIATGAPETIRDHPSVREAYLGGATV